MFQSLDQEYYSEAEKFLEEGKFVEASKAFVDAKNYPQAAFAIILAQDLVEAKNLALLGEESIARDWVLFIIDLLSDPDRIKSLPGFLSFRLFFEGTISYFLKFNLDDYFQRIVFLTPALEKVFPEIRKFIGSAYLTLGDYDSAFKYLEEAQRTNSQDLDIYFKLGELCSFTKNYDRALAYFNKVLYSLPGNISSIKYIDKIKNSTDGE